MLRWRCDCVAQVPCGSTPLSILLFKISVFFGKRCFFFFYNMHLVTKLGIGPRIICRFFSPLYWCRWNNDLFCLLFFSVFLIIFVQYLLHIIFCRMHSGPITCLAFTDDQLIISGSSLGSITVSSLSSDQRVALLRPSTAPTGDLLYAWARMNTFTSFEMS